jgi:hypothetical protein
MPEYNPTPLTLPWSPQHLFLRGTGSRVTKITALGHSKNDWWVVCEITHENGNVTPGLEYHPGTLVYDSERSGAQGKAESDQLSEGVMAYLREHGTWNDRQWIANDSAPAATNKRKKKANDGHRKRRPRRSSPASHA